MVTVFVSGHGGISIMAVYNGRSISGTPLGGGGMFLSSKSTSQTPALRMDPNYPDGGTTYFFNMGLLLPGLTRDNACILLDSETDYPRLEPHRSTGADSIGNHAGMYAFGKETFTFWITYNRPGYVLPHSESYDWDVKIACL